MNRSDFRPLACLAVVVAWLTGCSSPSVPRDQGGGAILDTPQPGAMRTPGWLQFGDLSLHSNVETEPPREPFVRGWIIGGLFHAEGEVVGVADEPPPRRILTRGWLHLVTRAFTPDDSPRPRRAPYVDGWHDDETGGFQPSSQVRFDTTESGTGP